MKISMNRITRANRLLSDILIYIIKKYPRPNDLYNYRLTKMVYLLDWHFALHYQRQATDINWVFDNYGPFVWDIKDTADNNTDIFNIEYARNMYGSDKYLFSLKDDNISPNLDHDIETAIDYVIKTTANLDFSSFTKLVYSTYPIVITPQYQHLNLVQIANEYRQRVQK